MAENHLALRLTARCSPFRNGSLNSLSAAACRQIPRFAPGVAVRRALCRDVDPRAPPPTVLKTAGPASVSVHGRSPWLEPEGQNSPAVRHCPRSSADLAVFLA